MIPKNWINKELGDVAFSTKGKKPKYLVKDNSSEFSIPYVNIKAFEGRGINEYTNGEKCVLCKSTDILIVWDGARFGLVGKGVAGAIGSTLAHIQSKIIVDTLLFYFLQYHYRYIQSRPKGVGIPHVDPNILWKIKILIPPLNEQHRIVEKIEELFTKLDASVTELKNVKKQLKRYRQSVLKSAFEGKFDSSKSKWNIYTLGELILQSQLGLVRSKREQNNLHQGTAYIKMNNVGMDGSVSLNNLVYVEVSNEEKNKYLLKENDILFNTRNSLELVGKTGIIKRLSEEIIYNNNLMRLRFGENINPQFIVCQMCSLEFRANMELVKKSTTNVAAIYAKDLFPLKIKAPSIDEQKLIVEEIETRLSVADKIEEEIDRNLKKTEQLRQSILKKAFEGKLVPQDPNDEPAEKLLERIKKEKE